MSAAGAVIETAGWLAVAAGAALQARAGTSERRGRLEPARRTMRRGGTLVVAGLAPLLCGVGLALAAEPGGVRWAAVATAPTALAGATAALLGGLAGKPRPSGTLALALLLLAAALRVWSLIGGSPADC